MTTGDGPASDFKIHRNSSQTLLCFSLKKLIPDDGCDELFFLTKVRTSISEDTMANGFTDILLPPPPSKYRILMSTEAVKLLEGCLPP